MESVDRERTIRMLSDLVRIESINPSLDPNGRGERAIAWYIREQLCVAGVEVSFSEPVPGRVSTIARLPGSGSGPTLVLNAHVDTVGVAGMADPFGATIRDGRLHGRGAYDMKGSLAACMAAMTILARRKHPLAGDVVLHAVADEEHSSIGTYDLVGQHQIDAAIVTEPTALQICEAHKGFIWLEVETLGRAAHGSQFELGLDANVLMGRFLGAFDDLVNSLRARPPHRLLGPPSMHAATLNGGSGLSTYAASCRLGIERRTLPNESADGVIGEIRRIIDRLTDSDPTFAASLRVLLERPAFEMRPDSRIARALDAAAALLLGTPPRRIGENPWMDASIYAAAGIDTVVFGVAGGGAHSANEWVEIESVIQLADILADTAATYADSPC